MPTRLGDTTGRVWLFDTHETPEREIYLLLQHVAGAFLQELAVVLRPAGITPEQYHVLKILRDAGPGGLACSAIGERSPSGDPDVTRLLDRLETQGWASRTRDPSDRRVVVARITNDGLHLLAELEEPVATLHARQLEGLSARELPVLRKLLQTLGGARQA
ncbi:MAG TPA: MarR family transcriptional regulator [Gemmatimonadaceae bacterium]|nr:MarR family transcriptional regulator [Gemmatimonadaceae bacterium]